MSADRYEITVTDILARVEYPNGCTAEFFADTSARDRFAFAAIRQQSRDIEQLRTDLAAAVAENAALLAANRDLKAHFDALKGDYDEAAHFARHFIRDDPNITPRGAIIRLGDKCTDMFCRLQQAEARLAAIESAPTVAMLCPLTESAFNESTLMTAYQKAKMPHVELIARPAKD